MILSNIIGVIVCTFFGLAFFAFSYIGVFSVMLSDDVEFSIGKTAIKHNRKKEVGVFRKILFLNYLAYIKKWHYFIFISYIVFYILTIILLDILILYQNENMRRIFIVVSFVCFLLLLVASCVRWSLYWYSVKQRPKKTSKNKKRQ